MAPSATPTAHLPKTHLFRYVGEEMPKDERIELFHKRAQAIIKCYKPNYNDVAYCSEKFWNMHIDMINSFDGAAWMHWTLQLNLAGGTLAPFIKERPELVELWDRLISFDITAHFMLTELGHGLDARNLETTATLMPDGGFDFHTPNPGAAKFMPATIPSGGSARVAIVMARLMIDGHDRGIRPFIVPLNDGKTMCIGVTCRPLPERAGSTPLGHAITSFDHVKLPSTALLGDLNPPQNPRLQFLENIWRIGIGSICLTAFVIPALKVAAYVTGQYSKRRKVTDPQGQAVPIISFRTQQEPILQALAQASVLEAFFKELRPNFIRVSAATVELRNGLSTIFKTVAVQHWRQSSISLADRCGAQGLYNHNQIIPMQMEIRGITIAEGDVLVLCIRLASELLLGRYKMPAARYPDSPLARHERGVFEEMLAVFSELGSNHRGESFNRRLLPRCVGLVQAIGHRMTYEAAFDAGVDIALLRVYEAGAIMLDVSWYVEHQIFTRQQVYALEEAAFTNMLPRLDYFLKETGAEPYAFAAITSEDSWNKFFATLPVLQGNALVDPLNPFELETDTTSRARL